MVRNVLSFVGKLPDYNAFLRQSPYEQRRDKNEAEMLLRQQMKVQGTKKALEGCTYPLRLVVIWHEAKRRNGKVRDLDNCSMSMKFILDAMQQVGAIPDDSPKYIKEIDHLIHVHRQGTEIGVEVFVDDGKED